jgi:predicted  nucleic acid-binding Zn-ribbon protein
MSDDFYDNDDDFEEPEYCPYCGREMGPGEDCISGHEEAEEEPEYCPYCGREI